VLPAIEVTARFGEDPDIAEMDRLAKQRGFPVVG
jgi:hypothetical protein